MHGGGGWRPPPTDAVLNKISQEFRYADIVEATSNFSASNRLGEGTYGAVFRGVLHDGTEVAIKVLAQPKEGGFREEVEVLSRFRHPNLVILMGFARNGRERYLIYELLPGGDLNSRLNKDSAFTWRHRLSVVQDAALGLSHLHGSRPQVFHRDVKTQNILMDKNGTGKVADFGLACLAQPNQQSLTVAQASGTIGYADPLYISSGVVTEKSEVYSMGMVLLEVLTGRPPALQHPNGRIEYQFDHLNGELQRLSPMVDRRAQWPPAMVEKVGMLALQCTCQHETYRPTFVEIVTKLREWLREEPNLAGGSQLGAPLGAGLGGQGHGGTAMQDRAQRPSYVGDNGTPYAKASQQMPWLQQGGGAAGVQQPQAQPQYFSPEHVAGERAAAPSPPLGRPNPFGSGSEWEQREQRPAEQRPIEQRPIEQRPIGQRPIERRPSKEAVGVQVRAAQPGFGQRNGAAQMPQVAAPAQPAPSADVQGPPGSDGQDPEKEEMVGKLVEMGIPRAQALEAFKRNSSVEAAIAWHFTNSLM